MFLHFPRFKHLAMKAQGMKCVTTRCENNVQSILRMVRLVVWKFTVSYPPQNEKKSSENVNKKKQKTKTTTIEQGEWEQGYNSTTHSRSTTPTHKTKQNGQ